MSNRTRYGCRRKIDYDASPEPAILMQCPRCDEQFRTMIAEMIELSKKEYLRGFRDGALAQDAQADRILSHNQP